MNVSKYANISTAHLKKRAIKYFNAYIRLRDSDLPCISCGRYVELQCGHFYSAGNHNHMRFLEHNSNGQCLQCNYFLSGNLLPYRENLIEKIGLEAVEHLDFLSKIKSPSKDDRFLYMEIIEKYSKLIKQN